MKRKIIKQFEASNRNLTTMLVVIIMFGVAFSAMFVLTPSTVRAGYTDYANHKRITIESSFIDATLADFPILVHDDTGDLLGEVLNNASDIGFWNDGNSTQYNHEIEWFNWSNGELWVWVNVTSISSSVDTVLWMYYGDSDGGYPIGYNPTDVWDSNYVAVFHMNDASGDLDDKTSNSNDFADSGSPTYQQSGKIGYSILGDGSSACFENAVLDISGYSAMSVECWYKNDNLATASNSWMFASVWQYSTLEDIRLSYRHETGTGDSGFQYLWDDYTPTEGEGGLDRNYDYIETWQYYASTLDNNAGSGECFGYLNTTRVVSDTTVSFGFDGMRNDHAIGARIDSSSDPYNFFKAFMDEFRISDVARSQSWLNASFHTQNISAGFIKFGDEESGSATTSVDAISPYWQHLVSSVTVNASNDTGTPDNVTLWYRWSDDNTSWDGGTGDFGNDTVDNNSSDIGSPTDVGSHSDFEEQKAKDSTYDTLTEEENGTAGNFVNDSVDSNTCNVDSSNPADVGNETSFENCQDVTPDIDYMNIQENDTGGSGSSSYFGDDTIHTNYYPLAVDKSDEEYQFGRMISCTADCTVDSITAYINCESVTNVDIKYAIYTGDGSPETIITNGETNSAVASAQTTSWVTCTFTTDPTLEDGNDYYLVILADMSDISNNKKVEIGGDTSGSSKTIVSNSNIYPTSFAFDTSWASSEYLLDLTAECSIFCNYTETGGIANYELDFEYQWTSADNDETNEYVCFEVNDHTGNDNLNVSYWDTSDWVHLGFITGTGWSNFTATGLTASTYTIRVNTTVDSSDTTQDDWNIDVIKLYTFTETTTNYGLDLEVQWTGLPFNHQVEQLCIYTGTQGAEALEVDVWNTSQSQWDNLISDLSASVWNNISITDWLTTSTFTIRYKGDVEASDTTQHTWEIDFARVHYYNTSGGSHGVDWMNWSGTGNPDTEYLWTWAFDCPNSTGYYEFYSIANTSGVPESAPAGADAQCHVNFSLSAISFTVDTASPSGDFEFKDWTLSLTGVGLTTEYNVSEDNQTAVTPALNITNTGSVAINITFNWSASPGSGITMKYNSSDNAPNPSENNILVTPSSTQIVTNLATTSTANIWLWMDFVNVGAGSSNEDMTLTSIEYE